ncbi:right-handed parallel beta-helix repeat-containing protein, partial [Pseudomonadota bacterium]|nr:right-handed parallel beta-helix repeat-containing protein [Pseudomonadota bacterium]
YSKMIYKMCSKFFIIFSKSYIFFIVILISCLAKTILANQLSVKEFTKITGSTVTKDACKNYLLDSDESQWLQKVKKIKLQLKTDKYLRDMLKKARTNTDSVSKTKTKYRGLKVKFNDSNCWFSGKYRLTGDMSDHFGKNNEIPHSIKIKLRDGKVQNIVKFKLLVPRSRGEKLEILNVLIHKKLALLAPRTAIVNVQIGGQSYKAIFQEDITKEFLEFNNFHESIIIEGDEGYTPLVNPKIVNHKFVSNVNFKEISKDVLEQIGHIYQQTSNFNNTFSKDSPLFLDFIPDESKKNFVYFHLLNFSLNTSQGLTTDDTRLVFDHISRKFHPIYYDGHVNEIITKISDINFEISEEIRLKLLKELQLIDLKSLQLELNNHGAKFSSFSLNRIIDRAILFLKRAKKDNVIYKKTPNTFDKKKLRYAALKLLNLKNLTELKISWMLNNSKLQKCVYSKVKERCAEEIVNPAENLSYNFLPQSEKKGIFLHGLLKKSIEQPYYQELQNHKLILKGTGTTVEHTSNLNLNVNDATKTVTVYFNLKNKSTSQIKVSGGSLIDWTFKINKGVNLGYTKVPGSRASEYGLTGCVTFNDIFLESLKIFLEDAKCEDAVHFVRARGNIQNITIKKASSDAIDADFSKLDFQNLNIFDAGNDCVDFSGGNYKITNLEFSNCGDKGISAGENSEVFISNGQIKNALIGIVAKDSSKIVVDKIKLLNVGVCLATYNKKQEFGGGLVKVNNIYDCPSNYYFVHNGSNIKFLQ